MDFPNNVPDLIDYLSKNYRYYLPKVDEPERSIWKRIGQCELIEKLKAQYEIASKEGGLDKTIKGKK